MNFVFFDFCFCVETTNFGINLYLRDDDDDDDVDDDDDDDDDESIDDEEEERRDVDDW